MWHHKGSVTCLGCLCPSSPTAGSSGDRGVWNSRIPLYFTHPTWGRTAQLSAPGQESLLSCRELGDPPCLLNSRGGKGTGKKGKKAKKHRGKGKGREEKRQRQQFPGRNLQGAAGLGQRCGGRIRAATAPGYPHSSQGCSGCCHCPGWLWDRPGWLCHSSGWLCHSPGWHCVPPWADSAWAQLVAPA